MNYKIIPSSVLASLLSDPDNRRLLPPLSTSKLSSGIEQRSVLSEVCYKIKERFNLLKLTQA